MNKCTIVNACLMAMLCGLPQTLRAQATESPAEEIKIQRPFLWQITRDSKDVTPSWLFGTIHVAAPQLTKLHPVAQDAFDQAGGAWFEIDLLGDMQAQLDVMSLPEGRKTEDVIPAELLARLDARLAKISPVMNRDLLPAVKVAVWPLLLSTLDAQMKYIGNPPLDLQLYLAAQRAEKTIGGLEDPAVQLRGLTGLSDGEQLQFLQATLDDMDRDDSAGADRLTETMRNYASGDPVAFGRFMDEEMQRTQLAPELTARIQKALLWDRNRDMARAIHRVVSDHRGTCCFFAVGVGHLTGKETVQDHLAKLGYRVTLAESKSAEPDTRPQ